MKVTRRWPNFKIGIAAKLAVCLVLSATAILAVFGWLNLRLNQKHSEDLILASAERLCDIILQSTRHEMMRNDREALYNAIRDIGREPGIRLVRTFNKEGRISFSTDTAEIGKVVDKSAEACYACHAQGVPLERLNRPDSSRIFASADDQRVLAMVRPIRNDMTCSSASCHAHPREQKVLGVIDVHLSLAAVDAQSANQRAMVLWFSTGAVIVLCGISIWFVWTVLHKPIKALIAGTHRVADGDLGHRLRVSSNDELGDLATSFNRMTTELAAAHDEITAWAGHLEERVQKKSRELELAHNYLAGSEKMASIGKLAATVAHELNNPLFGILTHARLCLRELEKNGTDTAVRARLTTQLQTIERESRRCGDIIRNLLTYARQAPRKRELNDINVIVERAVTLIRHQLELQSIELRVISGDLPHVYCDAGQIQQVILILLANAAEATGENGRISITAEPAGPEEVRIRISDNGGGIPPDVLPQIFDPFFTTKEDNLRTGLGLAVAKSIVEQHGGSIHAVSDPGQGAELIVRLPVAAPALDEVSATPAATGRRT